MKLSAFNFRIASLTSANLSFTDLPENKFVNNTSTNFWCYLKYQYLLPENCDPIGSRSFSLSSGLSFHTSSTKFLQLSISTWPLSFKYVSSSEYSFSVIKYGSMPTTLFFGRFWTSHSSIFGAFSVPIFIKVQTFLSSCLSAWAWYRLSVHSAAAFSVITTFANEPVNPETYWTRRSLADGTSLYHSFYI